MSIQNPTVEVNSDTFDFYEPPYKGFILESYQEKLKEKELPELNFTFPESERQYSLYTSVYTAFDLPFSITLHRLWNDDVMVKTPKCNEHRQFHSHIDIKGQYFYFDELIPKWDTEDTCQSITNFMWGEVYLASFSFQDKTYYVLKLIEICNGCSRKEVQHFLIVPHTKNVYWLPTKIGCCPAEDYLWYDFNKDGNLDVLPLLLPEPYTNGDTAFVYSLVNHQLEKQPYYVYWCWEPPTSDYFIRPYGISSKRSNWYQHIPLKPMPTTKSEDNRR